MATTLYEIICPERQNNGQPYYMAHKNFRRYVAEVASGYTVGAECLGFWRDPQDGKEYKEAVTPIRICCAAETFAAILRKHQECYPDQEAVMWYTISHDVTFTTKPKRTTRTEELYNALTSEQ